MKKNLLILTALFICIIGYSQTFTDANFIEYTIIPTTNTVEVTDYDYVNGGVAVNIPPTVDYNSTTYNVTEIGDEAFLAYGSTEKITSVIIPNGVTFIGNRAFQGNLLTTVIIPDSVTQLTSLCFAENPLLTNVTLSNSLTSIVQFSFISCALIDVIIPDSVTTIGLNAFRNNQLTSVIIPNNVTSIAAGAFGGNPLTCVISEAITPPTVGIQVGGNTNPDSFGGSRSNIDLSIPSGTASAYATAQWTGFNSVAEGLTGTFVVDYITYQINANANNEVTATDYNTAGGTIVVIPAIVSSGCTDFSVTDIGNNSFRINNLTSVTIPDSVINIGQSAFNTNNLTSVTLPDSVINIGQDAFKNNNLTSVTIPDSVITIGQGAFNINSINNLILGNNVETIGNWSFRINNLTSVTIPDSVTSIGVNAFLENSITNLVLGNSVETIGDNAFANNFISSIIIPSSVTTIGDYAFAITTLTDVFSESTTPPTIVTGTNDTFASIANRGTIHLHIPPNTQNAYVTDAGALWTDFMSVTEDALSTSDFEFVNGIKIFTSSNAIHISNFNCARLENYTLYSITGSKVASGNENIIATDSFASGIYILKLDFDRGTVTKKVVVN